MEPPDSVGQFSRANTPRTSLSRSGHRGQIPIMRHHCTHCITQGPRQQVLLSRRTIWRQMGGSFLKRANYAPVWWGLLLCDCIADATTGHFFVWTTERSCWCLEEIQPFGLTSA